MCNLCGISLNPPCIIICENNCGVCHVQSPIMRNKVILDMASDVFKTRSRPQLSKSKKVRFTCDDVTSRELATFLTKVYGARISPAAGEKSKISKKVTGTLADILKKTGLESSA